MPGAAIFGALLLSLALPGAATTAGAQNNNSIFANDFSNHGRNFALTATVPLRRGVTTRVHVVKDFIDLVSFESVSMSGGGTISQLANGRTTNGMGFIAMNVAVPASQDPGSTITLKVGGSDVFKFKAVHRGLIAGIAKSVEPETIVSGTPWSATITGTDIGGVELNGLSCHSVVYSGRTANAVVATLSRRSPCTVNTYGFNLKDAAVNDPPTYALANGTPVPSVPFSYLPAGVACISHPNMGVPTIRQPQGGQVFSFLPGTVSPTSVTVSWDSLSNTQAAAPNNEFIVTTQLQRVLSSAVFERPAITTTTVRGLSRSLSFAIPGVYVVTVKAKNCDQNATPATMTFSMRYQ